MKKIWVTGIILLGCILMFWISDIIKCEILTMKYGAEFDEEYVQTNMISSIDYFKIISYKENIAKIYYVSKNVSGNLVMFEKCGESWCIRNWETVWSKSGSADGFILPYIR